MTLPAPQTHGSALSRELDSDREDAALLCSSSGPLALRPVVVNTIQHGIDWQFNLEIATSYTSVTDLGG